MRITHCYVWIDVYSKHLFIIFHIGIVLTSMHVKGDVDYSEPGLLMIRDNKEMARYLIQRTPAEV